MATQVYTITLTQLVDGKYAPVITGNYYLRLDPFLSNTYGASVPDANGTVSFSNVTDGFYQLWNASAQVEKWGTKWIGDDSLDKYATTAALAAMGSATANLENEITSLESATASIASSLAGYAVLSGTNAFTNTNTFTARQTLNGNITVSGDNTNQIYNLTNFQSTCPVVSVDPTNSNALTRKLYVDNAIASISVGTTAANQQSINVRRLVPAGFQEVNRLYTTWGEVVANAGSYATSAQQYTILIEGEGNTGDKIDLPVHTPSTNEVFHDYVNVRGLGTDLKINMNGSETQTLSASVIGRIVWEDLYLYGAADTTQVFKNMIFKNCKFNGTSVTDPAYFFAFQNCVFEGTNYFIGSMPTFTSCSGTRVFTETVPTIVGTTMPYYSPDQMNIGAVTLTGVTGSLRLSSGLSTSGLLAFNAINTGAPTPKGTSPTITNYYGGDTVMLTEPEAWLNLTVNGVSYAIPLYQK